MTIYAKSKDFLNSPIGKQCTNYTLFYAVIWVFHLIIVSVISYFHLILNHSIGTIADWIIDRGWIVISISKIVIFSIAVQFMKLKTKKYVLIKGMLRNSVSWPRHESFVLLVFLLLGIITIGNIHYNPAFILDFNHLISSSIGTLVFFGIDLFFILILDIFNPLKTEEERKLKIFIFPFMFYLYTRATFVYEQTISFNLYGYFLLILYFAYWRRRNWTLPIFLIISFFLPLFVFMGLDPVTGPTFSIFSSNYVLGTPSLIILVLFSCAYLEWRKRKYPEYIYRD